MRSKKSKRKPTKAQRFAAIQAARGMLRPQPGAPSLAERMAILNAEDRALEKRRDDLLASIGKGKPMAADKLLTRLQKLKAKAQQE